MSPSQDNAYRYSYQGVAAHIREVQGVADGMLPSRDKVITDSWQRCLADYKLDPVLLREPYILPGTELKEHRERLEKLIRTARYGLELLYKQIAQQNYVLLLTDADGVTVDFMGDASIEMSLRKAGLYLGAEWSESRAGTCGVGSCIYTGQALTVHQNDHFDATHTPLTCTAAPIFDSNGKLAAVLDVSALHSPTPKISQAMTLQLVTAFTRRIEMASLMRSFPFHWILRMSQSPEFLDVDPDCAVAVDDGGRVVGMTHSALQVLMRGAGYADCDIHPLNGQVLMGKPISDFFDFDFDRLPELTRSIPAEQRVLGTQHGDVVFAHAIEPQQKPVRKVTTPAVPKPLRDLYCDDPLMESVAEKASRLADSPISLMICGETGSGKEFLARAIHQTRKGKGPFVAINCAAIPENLIESELFGYAPGAFTGAQSKGKQGLIEKANGGTLFLDEIGDMPLVLQARLLRVLAEKEVTPVGGTRAVSVNIRVLAASHQNLLGLVKSGKFREDLYYRISGAVLNLPALREREDLPWLANMLLAKIKQEGTPSLSAAAMGLMKRHNWPGNLRELNNALEFASVFCRDGVIEPRDLPESISQPPRVARKADGQGDDELPRLLESYHWNISAVARELGVDRSTVHRRMKRAGLVPPNRR